MSSAIRHVSDTALWVAMYRAIESERPDALFRDPLARRMAGPRGEAIMRSLPFAESLGWTMIVRTRIIDDLIARCIADGTRTVINLGAGLDTRAFRLDLPKGLRWFDVDLPQMIDHRLTYLQGEPPVCEHAHLAVDLRSTGACDTVRAAARDAGGPALVVSEGLLVYLAPREVERIATQLHGEPAMRWWLTDLVTPLLSRMVGTFWQSALAGAPFCFAPANDSAFFEPFGWRERDYRSIWDESIRLERSVPFASFWSAFGRLALPDLQDAVSRISGVVLLERVDAAITPDGAGPDRGG